MTQPIADVRQHIKTYSEVDPETGCWKWTRAVAGQNGYGRFVWQGKSTLAHRASYETFVGPVPAGLELDHLCRERSCVNPEHLEAVTQRENARRGLRGVLMPTRTHCVHGHALTPENSMPRKAKTDRPSFRCRACHNADDRRSYAKDGPARYARTEAPKRKAARLVAAKQAEKLAKSPAMQPDPQHRNASQNSTVSR